jgi:dTDP-4-dehydrorhamnose reductase
MKILLLGANGQVGFELARTLAPLGELQVATRDGLLAAGEHCLQADLANPETLDAALHAVTPDIVVNAAAYTAVDRAEDEENLADRVNHWALTVLGAWAARHGALVVHYSTDYVFDGGATQPYREDDPTAPLGVYGRTKLAGENALRASGCEHLILRTAWVFGARGHNFLRTMLRLARERDELRVVNDQRGAPTTANTIASATAQALSAWLAWDEPARTAALGTYHLCAAGQCSWFEFAQAIITSARRAGLIGRVPAVLPIATADYPTRARRPAWSVLDTAKIRATFGLNLPRWEQGLDAVIGELAGAGRQDSP